MAAGVAVISVRLKGEPTAVVVASEVPVVDDEGQVTAVRCPAAGCGALVDLVDGRIDRHLMLGRECHTSGVPVIVGED
ncbi:hypothetical protein EF919_38335 [Streptomyces sp. WAC02707]|uniref:hypothetical protein n=1 Tax=Streptomyces sp. WAC02707 TaxID=2487417 RepID=UPI000F78BD67|nr:hypothetical protein [Streptomyces sp. WAC02707]RSS84949.1 hypothetical protein EF919_38335 [Streptomyces sp. WAC02707]